MNEKTAPRTELVRKFIDSMKTAGTQEKMQAMWDKEFSSLSHLRDSTKKFYISKYYRPAIRAAFGEGHPSLLIVTLPREITDRINQQYRDKVVKQNRCLVQIKNWRRLLQAARQIVEHVSCKENLKNESIPTLIAALLLITGRRPYELMCTGRFSSVKLPYHDNHVSITSKWSLMFSGQAKTKGSSRAKATSYFEIPILAPSNIVLPAIKAFQGSELGKKLAHVDNDHFSLLLNSRGGSSAIYLRKAVKELYQTLWPEGAPLLPKCLRPLYAEISWKFFAPPHISKNSFFATILGHTEKDLETSLSYLDYYLDDPADAATNITQRQALIEKIQQQTLR